MWGEIVSGFGSFSTIIWISVCICFACIWIYIIYILYYWSVIFFSGHSLVPIQNKEKCPTPCDYLFWSPFRLHQFKQKQHAPRHVICFSVIFKPQINCLVWNIWTSFTSLIILRGSRDEKFYATFNKCQIDLLYLKLFSSCNKLANNFIRPYSDFDDPKWTCHSSQLSVKLVAYLTRLIAY